MRSHQRIYVKGSDRSQKMPLIWRVAEPVKAKMLNSWQRRAHKRGMASPDGLVTCLNKGDINNLGYLFRNIRWKNAQIGEYVIHPATENDSPYFGKIVEQRIREYEMFSSQNTHSLLSESNIQLVSYEKLS
jgi:hypothetical protein